MSTATIYATALHKQKDQYGCYGISILKDRARKTKDSVGQFYSLNKTSSQLGTLIYAVSLAQAGGDVDEIHVISDLGIIEKIYNGTVDDWEKNDWKKPNKQPVPQAELWKEIFELTQTCDLTFSPAQSGDAKMANTIKICKSESRKKKNLRLLMKGTNVEEKIAGQVAAEDEEIAEAKESKASAKSVATKGKRGATVKKQGKIAEETESPLAENKKTTKTKEKTEESRPRIIATVEPIRASQAVQAMQESQVAQAMQEMQATQAMQEMQVTQAMQEMQATQAMQEMQATQAMQEMQASQAMPQLQTAQSQLESVAASNRESMISDDSIVLDSALKANCESLFAEIGLDLDTAVNLFLKHSLRKKGLTLDLKLDE